jgi:acetyltransferase-like isoleucine patch superfamily enzyme
MNIWKRRFQKVFGIQPDIRSDWSKSLSGNFYCGAKTILSGAALFVNAPLDCSLTLGDGSFIHCTFVFEKAGTQIQIGQRTYIGNGTIFDAATDITIGNDVLIAHGVTIMDHNSHSIYFHERKNDIADELVLDKKDWSHVRMAPVVVQDKAWVGAKVIILKGVTIGEGSVVGAGSVVTKSVPPWTVVAGNPAKVIREIADGKQ